MLQSLSYLKLFKLVEHDFAEGYTEFLQKIKSVPQLFLNLLIDHLEHSGKKTSGPEQSFDMENLPVIHS